MKMIAIDSSGLTASVAIVEDESLIAEYNVQYKKTHSQTLLPMLGELTKMTELSLESVDFVAVASGPGSFTGLRIGSATAKGLAQAFGKPIVEISTLEGLACNLYGAGDFLCPIMDARRNEVYTAVYEYVKTPEGFALQTVLDETALGIDALLEKLSALGAADPTRGMIFLGDGVPVFRAHIDEVFLRPHFYAPAHASRQRAAAFAYLAIERYRAGAYVSYAEHKINYLRLSQAERERNEGIVRKGMTS